MLVYPSRRQIALGREKKGYFFSDDFLYEMPRVVGRELERPKIILTKVYAYMVDV